MTPYHQIEQYLLNPTHRVTVNLIGCGGTGSRVLNALSTMNEAMIALGHPGLFVTVWDNDEVTEANIGRQLFSPSDIGQNKASLSVTRVNRFFGTDWDSVPQLFHTGTVSATKRANITISCVDSAAARIEIGKTHLQQKNAEPDKRQYYWLDFGNLQKTGQVILGTVGEINQFPDAKKKIQPVNAAFFADADLRVGYLKNVIEEFPQLKKIKEKNQGPSCSLAQALSKQDLFINPILANHGVDILWKLFRESRITSRGCYVNLITGVVNPIKIIK